MRQTKEEAERTRERIFQSGLRLFSQRGFAATTMNDIAKEAGITRGAIYWHYQNKNDFFDEIVSRLANFGDQLLEEMARSAALVPEKIRTGITKLFQQFSRDHQWRAMQILLIRHAINHDEMAPIIVREHQKDVKIQEIFKEATEKGELSPDLDWFTASFCTFSFITGVFLQTKIQDVALTDRQIEGIAGFITRGLIPSEYKAQ